ncbi:MAG: hypothetical protein NVSMB46_01650 [Candidatus Saccharimonadales bacterium]
MTDTVIFQCPECGLHYKDVQMANQCADFCKEFKSCSLEITKRSIERENSVSETQSR